ncbi:lytic transglycosylase domain-containing protein [Salinarimonas soli]|uniref:Lytic transglycosylase domain-containing protein n=1 Tax=Salinarimonas soli TaxID=1638099 RepID=A0A5B2VG51_9HYPH|nr:lytic transglycosylase domain-containing protein [Salinarimonas soli]KAA2237470.1 lytic transglycosylase domain-containing protein [Salinarimonas soli]
MRGRSAWCAIPLSLCLALGARAEAPAAAGGQTETVEQALCRLIEGSARTHNLPVDFFTRLIWRESSFRVGVVSPAGAQGVAQFMPGTAAERGLADPFDPEQAIAASARFLTELERRFGNHGLAAAAYNGGPNRVANWLAGRDELRAETLAYVRFITGRSADEWAEESRNPAARPEGEAPPATTCLQTTALLRRPGRDGAGDGPLAPSAPWGVQLAGNFSKDLALASFRRARTSYASLLGDVRPMIIGTRMRSRGTRPFYRIRVPAQTRRAADELCGRIRATGGSCIVLPS